MVRGHREYGPWRDTPEEAYQDALNTRRMAGEVRHENPTIQDGIDLVLEHCRLKRTQGTTDWYKQQYEVLKQKLVAETPLIEVRPGDVETLIRERLKEVSPATVRHNLRALGRVFELALRKGWRTENPVRQVELPRVDEAPMDWFTRAELTSLLGRVDEQADHDLFVLFAYTGVRRSEVVRIQCRDVSLARGELWVRGKRRNRVIPIDADLAPVLERMLAQSDGVNLLPEGEATIRRAFRRWKAELKEPRLHPHALRHTFATLLVQAGERLDVIQSLLGHRSLTMVLRYVHQHGPESRRAVGRLQILPREEPDGASQPAQ